MDTFSPRTIRNWNVVQQLDQKTEEEWAKLIADEEAGMKDGLNEKELKALKKTLDPYGFNDYRNILPPAVLYGCRSMAMSFIEAGERLPLPLRLCAPASARASASLRCCC